MVTSKPQLTPMIYSLCLTANDSVSIDDRTLYCFIAKALQCVTITRFEPFFFVNKVCQYMHKPQLTHWKAFKRILRYLVGIATHGLHLYSSPNYSIVGFN